VEHDCSADQTQLWVNFAELGKQLGTFRWPSGKDRHEVDRRSVIMADLSYAPKAGGRYWLVANAKEIQKKFLKLQ